jgi:hypothetical protein
MPQAARTFAAERGRFLIPGVTLALPLRFVSGTTVAGSARVLKEACHADEKSPQQSEEDLSVLDS